MYSYSVMAYLKYKGVIQGLRLEINPEIEYKGKNIAIVDISISTANRYGVLYRDLSCKTLTLKDFNGILVSYEEVSSEKVVPNLEEICLNNKERLMRRLLYSEDYKGYSTHIPFSVVEDCECCPLRQGTEYDEFCGERSYPGQDPPCTFIDQDKAIIDTLYGLREKQRKSEDWDEKRVKSQQEKEKKKVESRYKKHKTRLINSEINVKINMLRKRKRILLNYLSFMDSIISARARISMNNKEYIEDERINKFRNELIKLDKQIDTLIMLREKGNRERRLANNKGV